MAETVLVVEDDATIREVISEYLKDAGFIALTAGDGKSALHMIEEIEMIDLYILDIMLPEISGLELLHHIRESNAKPVIMLTALSDEYTQVLSFDGKADDYVTKPFSPKILIKRVEALLRRTSKPADCEQLLQIGNISVNLDSYEAFENNNQIVLTLKEFDILKYLMTNNKKVLSRQQLLNLVWGYEYFGDERIVDVHIKNLRKKFDSDIISTVKGVGYKIDLRDES